MPQIPNSGPISLSDFATEFGGTAPHSMSEYYRNGANVPSNNSNVPTAGAFRFGQMRGAINEIILAATSGANVDLSSLFGANWTSTVPKRLTVPAGVTIGGTGSSAAIIIPSNMAGTLEIDNAGDIIGFGGAANGGAGGNAIQNSASGVTINNTGLLAGGGGGGGSGGAGGSGEVNNTADWSGREPAASWTNGSASVGYYWNVSSYHFLYSGGTSYIIWASNIGSQSGFPSFIRIGNNEYHRGPHRGSNKYEIYRQAKTIIAGGVGGSGGIGQGYNQTNTSGSSGSAGTSGSGTGGNGGAGSTYAVAGVAGSSGANGNAYSNGAGNVGLTGGAAGAAVTGTSVTMNNTGTIAGAVA